MSAWCLDQVPFESAFDASGELGIVRENTTWVLHEDGTVAPYDREATPFLSKLMQGGREYTPQRAWVAADRRAAVVRASVRELLDLSAHQPAVDANGQLIPVLLPLARTFPSVTAWVVREGDATRIGFERAEVSRFAVAYGDGALLADDSSIARYDAVGAVTWSAAITVSALAAADGGGAYGADLRTVWRRDAQGAAIWTVHWYDMRLDGAQQRPNGLLQLGDAVVVANAAEGWVRTLDAQTGERRCFRRTEEE